ncbi:hypothetical protein BDW22DRAFT_1332680 [Trametopsis cervina]|nr:hypothetical protein BDW22DRAFT_1332680 [Trametopsis cervina]
MVILIGDITHDKYRSSQVKHVTHLRQYDNSVINGDVIEFLGHAWIHDTNGAVTEDICTGWRSVGDPVCDGALAAVFESPSSSVGKDLLASVENYARDNPSSQEVQPFLDEVTSSPPDDIIASEREIQIAQDFFVDHSVQIMQALLHYSLAGGFASPRIMRTLQAVSYLVTPGNKKSHPDDLGRSNKQADDRAFARLLETLQFVLDVMACTQPGDAARGNKSPLEELLPGGEGWKSAVRVRLLHGIARRRASERLRRTSSSESNMDVPVSQEDMAATLGAFCIIPLWSLKRLGLAPHPEQERAYLALWRHVGFYLGVSPDILRRYFVEPRVGDLFLVTMVLDLFSEHDAYEASVSSSHSGATLAILRAISDRPLGRTSLEYNCAVTRVLVGDPLADHLGLPSSSLTMTAAVYWKAFVASIQTRFGYWYPRRAWLQKRRAVFREGLVRGVIWSLDMRQATFRPRTEVEGDGGAEIGEGVKEEEKVLLEYAGAVRLMKLWKEVLVEMVVVTCAVATIPTATVAWFWLKRR